MIGDVIISIGQHSIGISHEIEKISHNFDNIYSPQYLHIDDSSISLPYPKNSQHYFHSFQSRASHWYEAYHHGSNIMNTLLSMVEQCDNPRTITIIYDATTGLGSGLLKYLLDEISPTLPSLCMTSIGILSHHYRGGLNGLHAVMALESGFAHQCDNILRCLNDTEYILDSNGVYNQCTNLEPLYALQASDLYYLLPDPLHHNNLTDCLINTPVPHFKSNSIKDIRSTLWTSIIKRYTSNKQKSKPSTDISQSTSTNWEKLFRNLSINIHSLHISSPLFAPMSPYTSSSIHQSFSISHSTLSSFHSGDYLTSHNVPCPIEITRLPKILLGATPGMNWPSAVPYQSLCQGRKKLMKSEIALYYASPYGDHLLELCHHDAENCRNFGAYSSEYEEDEKLAIEQIQEYLQQ